MQNGRRPWGLRPFRLDLFVEGSAVGGTKPTPDTTVQRWISARSVQPTA